MDRTAEELIWKLLENQFLEESEYKYLIKESGEEEQELLARKATEVKERIYGKDIFTRGLIEFTNICKNNCFYCGIRAKNHAVDRYRLTAENIFQCVEEGYLLGFRTFVLQGGEDGFFSPEDIGSIISEIKRKHPDCAVTLSFGEHSRDVYQYWYDHGADRYLLRHETADQAHYEKLHPKEMSFENRVRCLYTLKEIGYQTGAGFMVGSPFQTIEHLAKEFMFLRDLGPDMVGIGPFISAKNTPFAHKTSGTLHHTLLMLSLIRLTFPDVLLPATTALGTIHPMGRELGIKAGANVVMPNLSPVSIRNKYLLYDNKICTGEESAQCKGCLEKRMEHIGYHLVVDRGDRKTF